MNTAKPSGPAAEWESARTRYPELHLMSLGRNPDDLSWLILGWPDGSISRRYWKVIYASFSEERLSEAAEQLLNFFRDHPFTFHCSGWVATALGRIILEDESAAIRFVRPYWSQIRRPAPTSTMVAFKALAAVGEGEHRQHWIAAANWMRRFYERKQDNREKDFHFANRALVAYRNRPKAKDHGCLDRNGLTAIAKAAFNYPELNAAHLCDRALVEVFPGTSLSTLQHVRASSRKKNLRCIGTLGT